MNESILDDNLDTSTTENNLLSERAIKWLEKIQGGKVTPKGWVLSTVTTANQTFAVTSQTKRTTNY